MTLLRSVVSSFKPHRCPSVGCDLLVPADNLMCEHHRGLIPAELLADLYSAWESLLDGTGSFHEYMEIRTEIVDFVHVEIMRPSY